MVTTTNAVKGYISYLNKIPRRIININSRLEEDLGLDSWDLAELEVELQKRYKFPLPEAEEAQKIRTVGDFIDYIETHKSETS